MAPHSTSPVRFRCEDLADAGVILIPRNSIAFPPLLADLTKHIEGPPPGSPPPFPGQAPDPPDPDDPVSAILWNQSDKPICAFTLIWAYTGMERDNIYRTMRSTHIFGVGHSPSLLLPFELPDERRVFETYWNTILPHSRRYLDDGRVLGTNADVRPPAGAEEWKGGVFRWGTGKRSQSLVEIYMVTLTLDAVFFATGECTGSDTRQLWEHVVTEAELYQEIGATAREGLRDRQDVGAILTQIEKITGAAENNPPPPPPPYGRAKPTDFRDRTRWRLAQRIAHIRKRAGDPATVDRLSAWADAALPEYRRSRANTSGHPSTDA